MMIKVTLAISICVYKVKVDSNDFVVYHSFTDNEIKRSLLHDYNIIQARIDQLPFVSGKTRSTYHRHMRQIEEIVKNGPQNFFYFMAVKTAIHHAHGVNLNFHDRIVLLS